MEIKDIVPTQGRNLFKITVFKNGVTQILALKDVDLMDLEAAAHEKEYKTNVIMNELKMLRKAIRMKKQISGD